MLCEFYLKNYFLKDQWVGKWISKIKKEIWNIQLVFNKDSLHTLTRTCFAKEVTYCVIIYDADIVQMWALLKCTPRWVKAKNTSQKKKKITGLSSVHKSKRKKVLWAKMMAIPASTKLQAYFKNYLIQLKIIASGKMKEF